MKTSRAGRTIVAALVLAGAACSTSSRAPAPASTAVAVTTSGPASQPWGMLLLGDHGYDLRYLESKDYEPPLTRDQFVAKERAEWLEDKRPPAEFRPPAATRLANGGWVPASGLVPVAAAMTRQCTAGSVRCDFAVMLGDNVYPDGATLGQDGHDDALRFDRLFREPFASWSRLGPDFRIYVALGNHDWNTSRAGALAQVDYLARTAPFYMDGLVYRVVPPAAHGEVELFVIDTTVLLAGETVLEDALADDGSELPSHEVEQPDGWTRPATELERGMVAWLERALSDSRARWKVVVGHHPLWSSAGSKYEQARVLRRLLLPVLCRQADLYVSGHDHTLELQYDDCRDAVPDGSALPLPAVVSGAASKQRALNTAFMTHQARKYPQLRTEWARGLVWGYAHLAVSGDAATLSFVTTPDAGSGQPVEAYVTRFTRRSAGARAPQ
ncbi:MAG TPA: metallophosphoesterase [Steroidobacteraceae bacterium]|nr:metallophosphoesterase [Steroidobacteraceae bacterium]